MIHLTKLQKSHFPNFGYYKAIYCCFFINKCNSAFVNNFTTGIVTFKLQKYFYNITLQTAQNGLNDHENSFNLNFLIC